MSIEVTALGILGKYRDALTSIDKALAIDPNNTASSDG